MSKVWKYEITKPENQICTIKMRAGAEILGVVGKDITAMVNPEAPELDFTFKIVGTDEEFDAEGTKYLGVYPLSGGKGSYKLFHVFQVM